jgi:endonuclease YncB( thermonuclease family)
MIRSFSLLVLLLAAPASAATVLSVGDGDTIRVMEGSQRLTIRLACIDAPETAQRPYGAASRQQLQQLIPLGAAVNLRIQTRDRYGRTVAEVFRDGRSVNLAMVSSGEAFAYRRYLAACDGGAYLAAEAQAKHQKRGFWSVPGGIEKPWDWRHGTKSTTSAGSNPASGRLGSSSGSAPSIAHHYRCKEIGSYARAQELLREGHTYLDRNGDGIACKSLRKG